MLCSPRITRDDPRSCFGVHRHDPSCALFFAIVAIALLVLGPACEDCVATPPTLINVEVDYMYAPDHIHRLYQNEIDAVVAMFGCQGITINV